MCFQWKIKRQTTTNSLVAFHSYTQQTQTHTQRLLRASINTIAINTQTNEKENLKCENTNRSFIFLVRVRHQAIDSTVKRTERREKKTKRETSLH